MSSKRINGEPRLSDLGEREIIRKLASEFPTGGFVPPGDDCGAIEIDDRLILLSTDSKADGTHFPQEFTPFDKGWSIAAANLSDVAAMGGIPLGFLIAYGLPRDTPFSVLHDIEAGIDSCLVEQSIQIIKADTKENKVLTLAGAAVGVVDKREVLLRKGSRPGDAVCVTGTLGGSALGLRSFKEKLGIKAAEDRFRRPAPRIKEGRIIAKSGAATSCMDISDGLSSSLYELMRASGNGFEIDAGSLPLHPSLSEAKISGDEGIDIGLNSGDEYELLFTARQEGLMGLRSAFKAGGDLEFAEIGRVIQKKEIVLMKGRSSEPLLDKGYEHFR